MIAVLAEDAEYPAIREFFELFKTPWEFYRDGREYDVLICSGARVPARPVKLLLVYGGDRKRFDHENGLEVSSPRSGTVLSYKDRRIPLNGNCLTFKSRSVSGVADENTREPAAVEINLDGRKCVRLGYDLFREIRCLLTKGQPAIHAAIPALEMHIALLRDLITSHSIPLVEIPPVPHGHEFIVCLTHDVDNPGIRNHKCDRTMFGFLYRATLGSLMNVARGRRSLKHLLKNWGAVLLLPFVHLGLAKDFWRQFDRYLKIEKDLPSTFFIIPRKGDPGQGFKGRKNKMRAAKYRLDDIKEPVQQLLSNGREIAVHGIDAWCDSAKGRDELEMISRITGAAQTGVRMHWLFFDEQSFAAVERAGFSYDSTVGYNEAIGYRAGTTQVFKPLETASLFELPMHVMDTALFYPDHMNLSSAEAEKAVSDLMENSSRFGGVLTVNWHDRSIAPERLWGGFYVNLLEELKNRRPWFATASQAVSWFKKRRSAVFENVSWENNTVRIKASLPVDDKTPDLVIQIHRGTKQDSTATATQAPAKCLEVVFNNDMDTSVAV